MTAAELQAGTARTFQSPPPGQRQPRGKQNLQVSRSLAGRAVGQGALGAWEV